MKSYLFRVVLFLTALIGTDSFAQEIEILLNDSSRIREVVKANSETHLYLKDQSIKYSDIRSVTFNSIDKANNGLQEKLAAAGVQIIENGKVKRIDTRYGRSQPQKGDKKVIIVCADSMDILYKRFGRHLALKGYAIDSSNKDFLTIKTALRPTSKWNVSYFLSAVIENRTVIITAQWKVNNSNLAGTRESGFVDWEFQNDKTSGMSVTVNSVLYTDLMNNLSDFDKVSIKYKQ